MRCEGQGVESGRGWLRGFVRSVQHQSPRRHLVRVVPLAHARANRFLLQLRGLDDGRGLAPGVGSVLGRRVGGLGHGRTPDPHLVVLEQLLLGLQIR